jgi:Antibiotic biosynthesis monooxygenase
MQTITAIIRAKKGHEATMRRALLAVADHVRINEPTTVGFFIAQDEADPCVFTTYERFADQAATMILAGIPRLSLRSSRATLAHARPRLLGLPGVEIAI